MKPSYINDNNHESIQLECNILRELDNLIIKLKEAKLLIKNRNQSDSFESYYINNIQHLIKDVSSDYYTLKHLDYKIENNLEQSYYRSLGIMKGVLYE